MFFSDSRRTFLHCLLLADSRLSEVFHHTQPMGTFAQRLSALAEHFPASFQYPLRIAQRLAGKLWAVARGFPTPFF
jgi:hypothetical protein